MNIKLVSLFIAAIIGVSGFFYFVDIIKVNAEQKKELITLRNNYDRLKVIQRVEHAVLVKRDKAYAALRKAHQAQVAGLAEALNKAQANDDCVTKQLPADVVKQLRQQPSAD